MNIKEHIEQGHYPTDEKGRAQVTADEGSAWTILCTDKPRHHPIVGYRNDDGMFASFPADGNQPHMVRLLPPPPRKVKVTRWAIFDGKHLKDGEPRFTCTSANEPARGDMNDGEFAVRMTGEYEEPWS